MRNACVKAGLPEPLFEEYHGFRVIFRNDIYTEEYLRKAGLNERQIKAVMYVKEKGKITNREYQELTGVKERLATMELNDLVVKSVFEKYGVTGRGTYYAVVKAQKPHETRNKGAKNGAKEITYNRIKGILEEFVGGRKKGIAINHVIGQIKSAVVHAILNRGNGEYIIKQVDVEIKEGKLFPYGPLSKEEMLKRLEEINRKFKKIKWDKDETGKS